MKQIIKQPPIFADNCDVDDIINYYNISYPKGKQLSRSNFKPEGIDISKLDPKDLLATIRGQMLNIKVWYIESQDDLDKISQINQSYII